MLNHWIFHSFRWFSTMLEIRKQQIVLIFCWIWIQVISFHYNWTYFVASLVGRPRYQSIIVNMLVLWYCWISVSAIDSYGLRSNWSVLREMKEGARRRRERISLGILFLKNFSCFIILALFPFCNYIPMYIKVLLFICSVILQIDTRTKQKENKKGFDSLLEFLTNYAESSTKYLKD